MDERTSFLVGARPWRVGAWRIGAWRVGAWRVGAKIQ